MAVAHDAVTESTFTTTSPHEFTHTPAGTPAGVIVFVISNENNTSIATAVTYGGVAMRKIEDTVDSAGETGTCMAYFLGAAIPTGAQTVSITHNGSSATKVAYVITVTADFGYTAICKGNFSGGDSTRIGESSFALGTFNALCYVGGFSGHDDVTSLTLGADMTELGNHDFGTQVAVCARRDAEATGTIAVQYTQAAEDAAYAVLGITEGIPIITGTDDAFEIAGVCSVEEEQIGVSMDATTEWIGLRFQGLAIPVGATITLATLYVQPVSSTEDEPDVTIFAEDADDSATFVDSAANGISGRARTTASVGWSSADLGADGETFFGSPDIKSVIQEVVDRAGWASGNDLSILMQGSATSTRDLTITAYESGANARLLPAFLYYTYTPPPPGGGNGNGGGKGGGGGKPPKNGGGGQGGSGGGPPGQLKRAIISQRRVQRRSLVRL